MLLHLVMFLNDVHEILIRSLGGYFAISIEIFNEFLIKIPTVPRVYDVSFMPLHGAKVQLIAILTVNKACTRGSFGTIR